jgi:hypothetical protein
MAALVTSVPRSRADIVGIEEESVVRVKRVVALAMFAEQELFEEPGGMGASGIDWINWSSGVRGAARRSVSFRTSRKAFTRFWARVSESENNDGQGSASVAATDADFVTTVSSSGENVALAEGFPENGLS